MKRSRGSLGKKAYIAFVTAAACASVHQVLQSSASTAVKLQQLNTILKTAKAIADLAAQQHSGGDSDDDDDGDDYMDADDGPVPTGAAKNAQWVAPLKLLITTVRNAINQLQHPQTSATEGSAPPKDAAPATSTSASAHASFPLPSALLQEVMDKLDSRSAATAARVCKSFKEAYTASKCFSVSEAMEGYMESVSTALESGAEAWDSDGSCEASFCLKFSIDGSAMAGIDLTGDSKGRMMRMLIPSMGPILATLGDSVTAETMLKTVAEKYGNATKPPPDPNSTPLAIFKESKPLLYNITQSPCPAAAAPPPSAPAASPPAAATPATSEPTVDGGRPTESARPAAGATADHVASAVCDVVRMNLNLGCPMHLNGDILTFSYQHGYKQREPGLAAVDMSADLKDWNDEAYSHGFYAMNISHVYSDTSNALIWAAGDDGSRIKAFKAPDNIRPANTNAACNREDSGNEMYLKYTLCTRVKGMSGEHAGLHVLGTKVLAVNSAGALLTWDIAALPAQEKVIDGPCGMGGAEPDEDDSSGDEERYLGDTGWRDDDDLDDLEATRGVMPHGQYMLARSTISGLNLKSTCMLSDSAEGGGRTLVVTYDGYGGDILVAYDVETQKVKHQLLGHVFGIESLSPAPTSWLGAQHLFATCDRGGAVKIWDIRSKSAAAAITLSYGDTDPLMACLLAATTGAATDVAGNSSSAGYLGAGMFCFAGGVCESVWCWDLRGARAQALYELSTGNNQVIDLAWHEKSSTLLSSCDSMMSDRFGSCDRSEYVRLKPDGSVPLPRSRGGAAGGFGGFGGLGGLFGGGYDDSDEDDEDEDYDEAQEERWWPRKGKHNGNEFKEYFNVSRPCMIAYRFGADVSKKVPENQEPCFGDYY